MNKESMKKIIRYRRQDGALFLCNTATGSIDVYVSGSLVKSTLLPYNMGEPFTMKAMARACDEIAASTTSH